MPLAFLRISNNRLWLWQKWCHWRFWEVEIVKLCTNDVLQAPFGTSYLWGLEHGQIKAAKFLHYFKKGKLLTFLVSLQKKVVSERSPTVVRSTAPRSVIPAPRTRSLYGVVDAVSCASSLLVNLFYSSNAEATKRRGIGWVVFVDCRSVPLSWAPLKYDRLYNRERVDL